MKKIFLLFSALFIMGLINAQTTIFSDNFESGTGNWSLMGTWGLSSSQSHTTSHSLTESPVGNYGDNLSINATMSNGVNLSSYLSANLSFWAKYTIEGGFDYMYLDVSPNGGQTWINIDSYDDTLNNWTQFNYSLGGYVGNSNVKIRFRFVSDGAVNYDGMYIDDVVITGDTVDNAAPLVLHTPPEFYQGVPTADTMLANIIDISGVQSAELYYRVDGGSFSSVNATPLANNNYQFVIPRQAHGAMVDYYFKAVDSAAASNTAITDTFSYISGIYVAYDNGVVDFVDSTGPGEAVAVKISLSGIKSLKSILIRNYTDVNRPNDSMLVHVWASTAGLPGADLITPFKVQPVATLQNTSPMTVIDLRPYAGQLSNLTGDIFIGFSVPSGGVWATITEPGVANRSYIYTSTGGWTNAMSGTSTIDFHFRAVIAPYCPALNIGFTVDASQSPMVLFTDTTANPSAGYWSWDFGDGSSSGLQNPSHTYANYGNYTVKLAAGYSAACGIYDTVSQVVQLNAIAPQAYFVYDNSLTPSIIFYDSSKFAPTQWLWNFDDNGATSSVQNPVHTFPNTGGTFNVCLIATNAGGSDTYCDSVFIPNTIGIEEFDTKDIRCEIFPNPFNDKATILTDGPTKDLSLKVYDVSGRQISIRYQKLKRSIMIYRGDLPVGQYFYEIYSNDRKFSEGRFMIY